MKVGKKKKNLGDGLLIIYYIIRWRSQFASDSLFIDIKYVLDRFCEPYLQLFQVQKPPSFFFLAANDNKIRRKSNRNRNNKYSSRPSHFSIIIDYR